MKILVIGAGGMLGHQMFKQLSLAFPDQVYGTVRKPKSHYQRFGSLPQGQLIDGVNVLEFSSVLSALNQVRPKWVINCVGLTLRKPDLADMDKCIEVNSMLPHKLALWAQAQEAKLIHFSTDCVFDGKDAPYEDFDIPNAMDLYGRSKFLGEAQGPHALTFRLSIVGRELEAKTELVEWFLSQKGKKVKGYTQAIYSGLTTNRVAQEVLQVIRKHPELSGMYQVSSEPISKYDLLRLLNAHFKVGAEIEPYAEYASNKTLLCKRYSKATGFTPPSWEEMIKELANDRSSDYEG